MEIIDLNEKYESLYFLCLEDWSDEIKEAGNHKARWYAQNRDKGLRVKLALDDQKNVGGMIQYLPAEHSVINGSGLYFIQCIWVHGYKQGRGNFQKKGMGKALLQAAEDDVRQLGAKGIAAWGVSLPFWMKAGWYKKQGYRKIDTNGISVLLWKPFTDTASAPSFIRQKKQPETIPGKVTVTGFINGICPAWNLVFERARRAASELGDKVVFTTIDTANREKFLEWGISDALYVDNKQINTGPPPTYAKLKSIIGKAVKKIK